MKPETLLRPGSSDMPAPLEGMRILAVEQYGAGPYATSLLVDLGAEVIKVETPPGGDVGRAVPPYAEDQESLYFESLNRNKKSLYIDTSTAAGTQVIRELVPVCDAVFNNLRGDQPSVRGLDYDALKDVNERIVCVHLNGFGRQGEYRADPAYDYLMQGYSGWMMLNGEPGSPPQKTGLSLVDFGAGMLAALALVSGVRGAEKTGLGGDLEVPLLDVSVSLLNYLATWHLTEGYEPARQKDSSHPSQVPSQILPTADGWMVVMCAKEKFFKKLAVIMELPELLEDERFVDFAARLEHRETLVDILKKRSKERDTADWLKLLRGKVPSGPVNSVSQAFRDPVVLEREMIIEVDHPRFGVVKTLRSPIRHGGKIAPQRGPRLGEHNEEVLELLDSMTEERRNQLVQAGVLLGEGAEVK